MLLRRRSTTRAALHEHPGLHQVFRQGLPLQSILAPSPEAFLLPQGRQSLFHLRSQKHLPRHVRVPSDYSKEELPISHLIH